MPFVKHRYGRTYFEAKGLNRSGIPLVALHGGPGGTSNGNRIFLELGKKRPVYIYDQIGSGQSSPTAKRFWNMATFVQELRYLIDRWGLQHFHLFGVSCGATLALDYFLATRDRRLQSLIFQSPFFSARDWVADARRLIKKMPVKTQRVIHACHAIGATDAKVYEEAVQAYYLKHVLRNRQLLLKKPKRPNPNGKKIYQYMWGPSEFHPSGTLRTYEKAKYLAHIDRPTLYLCGAYDEATPKTVRRYHHQTPDSQFLVIANASHAISRERPKALLNAVKRFIEQNDAIRLPR